VPRTDPQWTQFKRSPEQRPNASQKFGMVKWLYEIVIGAAIECRHAIGNTRPRGNDQDRPVVGGSSCIGDQLQTVAVR